MFLTIEKIVGFSRYNSRQFQKNKIFFMHRKPLVLQYYDPSKYSKNIQNQKFNLLLEIY